MKLLLTILCCLVATTVQAELIVRLERTGTSVDFPHLTLTNTGPEEVTDFSLTIGDNSMNFDSAVLEGATTIDWSLLTPDEVNNGVRSDVLTVMFTDFVSGSVKWRLDLDGDGGAGTIDWQTTLFNNGALPNAIATAMWSDGTHTSMSLPDDPDRNPLDSYQISLHPVPEPASIMLMFIASMCCFTFRYL